MPVAATPATFRASSANWRDSANRFLASCASRFADAISLANESASRRASRAEMLASNANRRASPAFVTAFTDESLAVCESDLASAETVDADWAIFIAEFASLNAFDDLVPNCVISAPSSRCSLLEKRNMPPSESISTRTPKITDSFQIRSLSNHHLLFAYSPIIPAVSSAPQKSSIHSDISSAMAVTSFESASIPYLQRLSSELIPFLKLSISSGEPLFERDWRVLEEFQSCRRTSRARD